MLIILSVILIIFTVCILYCITHCSTSYDHRIDDEQQERFLCERKQPR